ncbi:MAG: tyrosine-type recombinase/integrase [Pirellulales bacterium]
MRAWLFQDHRQKQKLGDDCPWSVGWVDPDGKRKSKSIGSRSRAEKFQRKTEGQLAAGTYQSLSRASWEQFQKEYESKVLAAMEPGTREAMEYAIHHFERIIGPKRIGAMNSKTVAQYVAVRRTESNLAKRKRENRPGKPVSTATVNKELRCLRAMLRKAHRWGYLPALPEFDFLKEPGKHPTYVTPEHFALLYQACDVAKLPEAQGYTAGEWWRGLLMAAYMTGWRIGSLLALRWEDIDLKKGTALSRAADNKGRRDQFIPLHPVVIEHLQTVKSFAAHVFPWDRDRRRLYVEFWKLQVAAKVQPVGKGRYGFHDLRRGFATMNADKLTPDALQALMQHKDYQTTQRYISMARQLNPAIASLYVPPVTKPPKVAQ